MATNRGTNKGKYLVHSLLKALDLLEALAADDPELGITELSERLGLGKSTVHRLCSTLQSRQYLQQNPYTQKYRLSIKLFELGNAVVYRMEVQTQALPYLKNLMQATNETVHLGILDQGEVVFINKVECTRPLRLYSRVGTRAPAHCTALGKVLLSVLPREEVRRLARVRPLERYTENTRLSVDDLLAELEEVRVQGVAFDKEEFEPDVMCIGAPIRDYTGNVIAAVSISGPTSRFHAERLPHLVEAVKATAGGISQALGYHPDGRREGVSVREPRVQRRRGRPRIRRNGERQDGQAQEKGTA